MSAGDVVTLISILVALWFVPRFLWRQYRREHMPEEVNPVVRSGVIRGYTGSGTGATLPVSWQQHQAASELVPDFEAVKTFLSKHKLTPQEKIDLLAIAQDEDGYWISANKIRDLVGGNEAAVKSRVASHRPKPPAPKAAAHLDRPVKGW